MIGRIRIGAALLLLVAATACEPKQEGDGSKSCDTRLYAPKFELVVGKQTVFAKSVSECDRIPDTHKVELRLEFLSGKNWIVRHTNPLEPYAICEPVPRPDHPVECTWRVYECDDGRWRTRATVTGRGDQGNGRSKDFAFEIPEKPEANIKCPRSKK